jgi:hypothetical protein
VSTATVSADTESTVSTEVSVDSSVATGAHDTKDKPNKATRPNNNFFIDNVNLVIKFS